MNFIFEVHLRRTTNPLGSKIEPFWVRSQTQKGSKNDEPSGFEIEPRGFEDRTLWVPRTQRVRSSNPLGSTNPEGFVSSNPSGFEIEPRGFDLRTLWVPRTQKGSKIRTLLGSWNAEGSKIEPSWVSNPLGSWNPEDSISNPEGFEDTNPSGFVERRGFEDRTLWVRSRTQKGSNTRTQKGSIFEPSGFNLEPRGFVVLRK
ncbi:hypothetical protein ACOSP7_020252 [Xanthoceras sorbifolium]